MDIMLVNYISNFNDYIEYYDCQFMIPPKRNQSEEAQQRQQLCRVLDMMGLLNEEQPFIYGIKDKSYMGMKEILIDIDKALSLHPEILKIKIAK